MIQLAENEQQILHCFAVMKELRTHLKNEHEFLSQVQFQQQSNGYQLAFLEDRQQVVSVAGFRISHSLAWEKHIYIDELITRSSARSQGYGDTLFAWLLEYGKQNACQQLHLDSGVHRFEAHRFYLRQRMKIASHHFSIKI